MEILCLFKGLESEIHMCGVECQFDHITLASDS